LSVTAVLIFNDARLAIHAKGGYSLGFGKHQLDACVDVHVQRITNRLGWFVTKTPDQTEVALARILPAPYWLTINRLMVQHGRAICLPGVPQCQRCPVRQWCQTGTATQSR
jgi:endonuclease-3